MDCLIPWLHAYKKSILKNISKFCMKPWSYFFCRCRVRFSLWMRPHLSRFLSIMTTMVKWMQFFITELTLPSSSCHVTTMSIFPMVYSRSMSSPSSMITTRMILLWFTVWSMMWFFFKNVIGTPIREPSLATTNTTPSKVSWASPLLKLWPPSRVLMSVINISINLLFPSVSLIPNVRIPSYGELDDSLDCIVSGRMKSDLVDSWLYTLSSTLQGILVPTPNLGLVIFLALGKVLTIPISVFSNTQMRF